MPNVNSNIIYQAGTLLADVVQQATGRKVLTANTRRVGQRGTERYQRGRGADPEHPCEYVVPHHLFRPSL